MKAANKAPTASMGEARATTDMAPLAELGDPVSLRAVVVVVGFEAGV